MTNKKDTIVTEKIRQLFDTAPYPKIPLEQSPKDDYQGLYIHNLATPYYIKNQKFIDSKNKTILDAGCGSGYKSLILAAANPGAKIVGIDLSEASVELAHQRLRYHGYENTEFHVLSIEDLPGFGLEFDYINCDEVLYLLPDIVAGLQAMKAVLKPEGILRSNLHSLRGRNYVYRAQTLNKTLGLMEQTPGKAEIDFVRQMMSALRDDVVLKRITWLPGTPQEDGWLLTNHLLVGDKGFTIPEMFGALRAAGLELLGMVNWRQWDLLNLFQDLDDLPAVIAMSLPETSEEDQLELFELFHPVHRLFDFWCVPANSVQPFVPIGEWSMGDWQRVQVLLHPQLRADKVKEDLLNSIDRQTYFEISRYLPLQASEPIVLESLMAACLLPLWDQALPARELVERWLQLQPLHPVTLEVVTQETAWEQVKEVLIELVNGVYIFLELL